MELRDELRDIASKPDPSGQLDEKFAEMDRRLEEEFPDRPFVSTYVEEKKYQLASIRKVCGYIEGTEEVCGWGAEKIARVLAGLITSQPHTCKIVLEVGRPIYFERITMASGPLDPQSRLDIEALNRALRRMVDEGILCASGPPPKTQDLGPSDTHTSALPHDSIESNGSHEARCAEGDSMMFLGSQAWK